MNTKPTALFLLTTLTLFSGRRAFGQTGGPRAAAASTVAAPTVTVLTAAAGAMVQSLGTGAFSLNLGSISYYKGTSTPGETSQKKSGVLVITTNFSLKIDCPGSLASSQVNVIASRMDTAPSHSIAVDGFVLGPALQMLVSSMPCGSSAEHRLDVQVPVSTPAGPIGSTIAFMATLKN
jgi:hypothetical protein